MKETNRIEFKRELTDDLEKEVVAFFNYREGGKIYIGLDDDGKPVGVVDFDAVQLTVKNRLRDNILPSCLGLFDVIHEERDGKDIININIASGPDKPYYLKKRGMSEKGCFIRVGSAAEPMTVRQIEDLFAKRTRQSLSKIKSNRQDLTFEQLKIYYNEKDLTLTERFKQNLELLTEEEKLNYVAYLMADENGTSIKVAKYAGTDRVDLIESNEYGYCSLIKATKSVIDKLDLENKTISKITSKERIDTRLWSPVALREAIINAIIHNDYTREIPPKFEIFSDRLEITSYGGLFEGMTQADFFDGLSLPRNKELMRIYKDLGMVEQLGSGVPRILQAYSKECFKFSDNYLRMIFPRKAVESHQKSDQEGLVERLVEGLVENQKRIVRLIANNPNVSKKEMSDVIGISTTAIDKNLTTLKKKKIIKRVGSDKGGSWQIINSEGNL
jgi:predicted HTH transcriptional regulator